MKNLCITIVAVLATSIVAAPQAAVADDPTLPEECTVEIMRLQDALAIADRDNVGMLEQLDRVELRARQLDAKIERKNRRIERLERLVRKLRAGR